MNTLRSYLAVGIALLISAGAAAESRTVTGTYRNDALGYAIDLPHAMSGIAGDAAGPERGLRVSLSPGRSVTVFGEPNSHEWKQPDDGVRYSLTLGNCGSAEISSTLVGNLRAAKGRVACGERVIEQLLAFRPGGGPIYWFRLETTTADEAEDAKALSRIAAGFRLIPWR